MGDMLCLHALLLYVRNMFVFKNAHNLSYGGNGKILLKTILTMTPKSFRPICYFNMQNKLSVD